MWVAETAATATHVVIAIERFYATRRSEIRASKMRGGKLNLVIAGAWIFAVLSEVPLLYVMTYDNKRASCYETRAHPVHAKTYSAFTFNVDFAIPLILMAVLYSKAVAALRRGSINPTVAQAAIKTRKRVTEIAITVTVVHALCWLPDVTSYLLVFTRLA